MVAGAGRGRQLARREAQSAVSAKRRDRLEKEKRVEAYAVEVTAGMVQRRDLERMVGENLVAMTKAEGLSLKEAVAWCDHITLSEARRLHAGALNADDRCSGGDESGQAE